MIIEPEKYFQFTIPKMHTILNGRERDFSDKSVVGYGWMISGSYFLLKYELEKNQLDFWNNR